MRKTIATLSGVALAAGSLLLLAPPASAENPCGELNQPQFQSVFSPSGGAQIVGPDSLSVSSTGSASGLVGLGAVLEELSQDDITFEFTTVGGTPLGYHLAVNVGEEGTTHLVYEPESYPEGLWWSTKDLENVENRGGGMGSEDWGTLEDFADAYPGAEVTGFGYEIWNGSSLLSQIGLGDCIYTFNALAGEDEEQPAPTPGPQGPQGPKGDTGAPGKDAQFEVVPNTSRGIDTGGL